MACRMRWVNLHSAELLLAVFIHCFRLRASAELLNLLIQTSASRALSTRRKLRCILIQQAAGLRPPGETYAMDCSCDSVAALAIGLGVSRCRQPDSPDSRDCAGGDGD